MDPDEYCKERGADAYRARLDKAEATFHFLADQARRKFDMRSGEGRFQAFQFLMPAIQRIPDKLERAAIANDVAGYLGVDPGMVLEQFRKSAGDRRDRTDLSASRQALALPAGEALLVRALLSDVDARNAVLDRVRSLRDVNRLKSAGILRTVLMLADQDEAPTFSKVEARLDESDRALLAHIVWTDENGETNWAEQAASCVAQLEAAEREQSLSELQARLKAAERAGNMEEALALMSQIDRVGARKRNRQVQ
jgi:DNA primase